MTTTAQTITVNLSPLSVAALDALVADGGTRTEMVNKAIQMFAEVQAVQRNGGGIWVQPEPDVDPVLTRYE